MKKTFSIIALIFISVAFVLGGCSCGKDSNGLKDNPPTTATISGNGGFVVTKGDYLYFINGFFSKSNIQDQKDNEYGTVTKGAIYRTKLVDGMPENDKDGFLTNADCVVPEIVGYEDGTFYIYDDYIFYCTPNNQKNSDRQLLTNLTDICRINIDGTNKVVLYTTTAEIGFNDWQVYKTGNKLTTLIKDGNKIVSVNANDKKPKPTVIAEDITSVAFITTENYDYNHTYNNNSNAQVATNYVYYTRNADKDKDNTPENFSGNILAKTSIDKKEELVVKMFNGYNAEITNVVCDKSSDNYAVIYKLTEVAHQEFVTLNKYNLTTKIETVIVASGYSEFYPVLSAVSTYTNAVITYNTKTKDLRLIYNNGNQMPIILNADIKILKVVNFMVYYTDNEDSLIKCIDVTTKKIKILTTAERAPHTGATTQFDIDVRGAYILTKYTSAEGNESYYLNLVYNNQGSLDHKFIGSMIEDDLPKEVEQEEGQDYIKRV